MASFVGLDMGSASGTWRAQRYSSQGDWQFARESTSLWTKLPPPAEHMNSILLGATESPELYLPQKHLSACAANLPPYRDSLQSLRQELKDLEGLALVVPYGAAIPWVRVIPQLGGDLKPLLIETPLAICVEMLIKERRQPEAATLPPSRWIVVSQAGPGPALEVTTVDAEANESKLDLIVIDWRQVPRVDPSTLSELLNERNGNASIPRRVVAVGESCHDLGDRIGAALGIPAADCIRCSDFEPVAGAARLAAASKKGLVPETLWEWSCVNVTRIVPRPLGILGEGGGGQRVWRQLVPARVVFGAGTRQELLANVRAEFTPITLAEITIEDSAVPMWLAQPDWPRFGLRLHSSWRVSQSLTASQDSQAKLTIEIAGPKWPLYWHPDESVRARWSSG